MRFRSSAGRLLNPVLTSGTLGRIILKELIGELALAPGVMVVVAFAAVGTCVAARGAARPSRYARSM